MGSKEITKEKMVGKRLLRDHQDMLYRMLCDLDQVCKEQNIHYLLFAGTMLGAVREQGFIPWDDDLDIVMLRSDYEKFLEVAQDCFDRLLPGKYYVQREFSTHWPVHFSKVRMNGTACIERYIPRDPKVHQGIYIDIFPCDNLSDHKARRKLQFFASKVVIAKALDRRGYSTDSFSKKIFMYLCKVLPLVPLRKLAISQKEHNSAMVHTFFGASSKYSKSIYPREWFTEVTQRKFREDTFPVSAHFDAMLKVLYGDYMTPTPSNQREIKVHAEIVDLHRSYEEYEGIQEKMHFYEYTRSIR